MRKHKSVVWIIVVLGAIALGAATATQITREEFDVLAARVKALEAHVMVLRQQVKNLSHPSKPIVAKSPGKEVKGVDPLPKVADIDFTKFEWKQIRRLEGFVPYDTSNDQEFVASAPWRIRWDARGDGRFAVTYTDPRDKVLKEVPGHSIDGTYPRGATGIIVDQYGSSNGVTDIMGGPGEFVLRVLEWGQGQEQFTLTVEELQPKGR